MKKPALLLALAGALGAGSLALTSEAGRAQSGSFTKSVETGQGPYYRLKVKLTYKGEPQDFDIVVGCDIRQINYRDGSRTDETGLVPQVFARRLADGKGLLVKPPRACRGETTANGRVQGDLLPIVVVYDNADTFAFGTAYLSEDAYENPLSVLTFGGATIEAATREEFDEFHRAQPNAITPTIYRRHFAAEADDHNGVTPWGANCYGFMRYRLPEDLRALLRQHWPAEQPRFWEAPDANVAHEIALAMERNRMLRSDDADAPQRPWKEFAGAMDTGRVEYGLATRRGGGQVFFKPGYRFTPAIYPDIRDWKALPWPDDPLQAARRLLDGRGRVGNSVDFRTFGIHLFAGLRGSV